MEKDGEDKHGLQTDELEKFRLNFESRCANRSLSLKLILINDFRLNKDSR